MMLVGLPIHAAIAAAALTQHPVMQQHPAATKAPALVFDHVTVIDVEHGTRLHEQRVVVAGHRIQALGPARSVPLPAGAHRVEARGRYLIPGLWDMHIHPDLDASSLATPTYQRAEAIYHELLANGITGIRDAGSIFPLDTLRAWKQAIAAGRRVAPRMVVSGPAINAGDSLRQCRRDSLRVCHPVHSIAIAHAAEARYLVDSLKAAGADMIKIREMPRQLWLAMAAAARQAGIPFGGHFNRVFPGDSLLPSTVDGLVASDSGARILDHDPWADVCGWDEDTVASLPRCMAAAARLRRNHTWIAFLDDPTREDILETLPVSLRDSTLRYTPPPRGMFSAHDSAWRPLTAAERRQLPTSAALAALVSDSVRHGRGCRRARLAYAADIPWMPGGDLPVNYHIPAVHVALLRPVLCGVPPWWALRGATLEPARALDATDSLGTIAAGKVADLVLLEGDPLEDIWNVTKIAAVVANGRYFNRAALDRLLAAADAEWREVITQAKRAEAQP